MGWLSRLFGWWTPIPAIKPVEIAKKTIIQVQGTGLPIPICGIDLLKKVEDCKLIGYADEGGVPTDGYGNTNGAQIGVAITQEKADADLAKNCEWAWTAVLKHVKVPLTSNQGGALLSFVYNLGETQFAKSSLLVLLNSGNYQAIPDKIKQFIYYSRKDGGRAVSQGLINRRKAEAALWIGADWRQA